MINHDFFTALDELANERGLDKKDLLEVVEKGIVNAYKKETGYPNAKVVFNEEKGELYIALAFNVVKTEEELNPDDPTIVTLEKAREFKKTCKVGEYFELKQNIKPSEFGRIAANSTKQIYSQEIRRLEREKAYAYFVGHEDEMITGTVTSISDNQVIFDLGYDISASVPKTEIAKEDLHVGAKVKLYLSKVEMTTKGPRVFVSRSDKNLIKRLFEDNIPEIKDGTIEIIGIARDPGDRTKVCVKTLDPNVDPLGSCLGKNGKRAKDIVDALGGEKVDIYEYSDDPKEFISNALKPAEVFYVQYDVKEKQALAVVPVDQFSLAIGKRGQNVRLAVQSSGWKIDIKNVDQALADGIDF